LLGHYRVSRRALIRNSLGGGHVARGVVNDMTRYHTDLVAGTFRRRTGKYVMSRSRQSARRACRYLSMALRARRLLIKPTVKTVHCMHPTSAY
jgi:hypothetical protein